MLCRSNSMYILSAFLYMWFVMCAHAPHLDMVLVQHSWYSAQVIAADRNRGEGDEGMRGIIYNPSVFGVKLCVCQ